MKSDSSNSQSHLITLCFPWNPPKYNTCFFKSPMSISPKVKVFSLFRKVLNLGDFSCLTLFWQNCFCFVKFTETFCRKYVKKRLKFSRFNRDIKYMRKLPSGQLHIVIDLTFSIVESFSKFSLSRALDREVSSSKRAIRRLRAPTWSSASTTSLSTISSRSYPGCK